MAEGGEVKSFCESGQPHEKGCEYYAEGGDVKGRDPTHAASGFLAKHGLAGLLALSKEHTPDFYNNATEHGHRQLDQHASAIFNDKPIPEKDHSRKKKMVDDWLDGGGITQDIQDAQHDQNLPEGGKVEKLPLHPAMLADTHPDDNVILQAAKGRIGQYLNSQKPQENMPKLAFDDEADTSEQKKSYEKARDLAVNPLGILKHIQDGTLESEHLGHFNSMYPELGDTIQKKLTEKITEAQLKGTKPSYQIRHGLSQIMGTPMSSDLLPQNIMAAQNTFIGQRSAREQKQSPGKTKSPALAKMSQSYETAQQARESRLNKT